MYIKKVAAVLAVALMVVLCAPVALAAESGSTWDQIKAAGSDLWSKTKEKAPEVWDKTKEKASDLYGKAKEKAPEVKEKVKTGINNAQEKISDYRAKQEDEFWGWFDNQTNGAGGTESLTPTPNDDYYANKENTTISRSEDDKQNPNVPSDDKLPNPNDQPNYEPGPNAADGGDAKDMLEQYTNDKIYYYDPDTTPHEAGDADTPPAADPEGDPDVTVVPAESHVFDPTVVLIVCATAIVIAAIIVYGRVKIHRMKHEIVMAEIKNRRSDPKER